MASPGVEENARLHARYACDERCACYRCYESLRPFPPSATNAADATGRCTLPPPMYSHVLTVGRPRPCRLDADRDRGPQRLPPRRPGALRSMRRFGPRRAAGFGPRYAATKRSARSPDYSNYFARCSRRRQSASQRQRSAIDEHGLGVRHVDDELSSFRVSGRPAAMERAELRRHRRRDAEHGTLTLLEVGAGTFHVGHEVVEALESPRREDHRSQVVATPDEQMVEPRGDVRLDGRVRRRAPRREAPRGGLRARISNSDRIE